MIEQLNKFSDGKIIYNEQSNLFYDYWPQIFFNRDNENQYSPTSQSFYYIRPEKYLALLEFDNMMASRKDARLAIKIAITSIIITLLVSIISMCK